MRSKLFVPGSRPELFEKALAGAADAVSFDLEDAVVPARKSEARSAVGAFLAHPRAGGPLCIVRVNPLGTPDFDSDLEAVVCTGLDVINLPKVESFADILALCEHLDRLETARGVTRPIAILANIETPKGVRLAAEIATSHPRVTGLQLGFGDLFEPLGIDPALALNKTVLRLTVRLAAAEAGVPLYDGAYPAVADLGGFRAEALAARASGLAGKSCIHPSQVSTANEVFFPTPTEIIRAREIVVAATERFGGGMGAFVLDGVMIDGPYVARAHRVIALSEAMK
jgi:citrate lyase subunit beta/citryl-CoA lyase